VVLGFGLGSRVLGKGSTPFTRALYPPGGEHLGRDKPNNYMSESLLSTIINKNI
jgi:hypothetical protein